MSKEIVFLESDKSKKIKFRNSNLVLVDEGSGKTLLQQSCYKIFVVFICGDFSITSRLIKSAKKFEIPLIFLNYNLKPYLSILPENKGNFLLRKKQYSDIKRDFEIAKHLVENKIGNQIALMQSLRYKTPREKASVKRAKGFLLQVQSSHSSQELLGIEGSASKTFFETYFKNMEFKGRKPRCKNDILNLLLDIGYHYLFNFIEANLELYGFDTYCGVYHKFFFQRKSLVCDIIEPFRCIIDRRLRKSFNLNQINPDDFGFKNGQYFIKREFNKKYTKIFLKEILKHKEPIFLYAQTYYRSFVKDKGIKDYPRFDLRI